MTRCWICGALADSGEHKAKASDVRAILGTPTQHKPFHLRSQRDGKQKLIALTEMAVANDQYGPCIAIAGYAIGPWCIDMTYWAPRAEAPPIIATSFKPSIKHKALVVNQVKS
jgi:hypothetical protein